MNYFTVFPWTRLFAAALIASCSSQFAFAQNATFDALAISPSSYWNGPDFSGQFIDGGMTFPTNYSVDPMYGPYWEDWAYSNMQDATTPGYLNQYSAVTGGGVHGSANYGIGYLGYATPLTIALPRATTVQGVYLTNTTYAYLAMRDGYAQSTAFTATSSFTLTISGLDGNGDPTGTPVDFSLASGRNIVNRWTWVDLSRLGANVKKLNFDFASTDVGDYGVNTPTYVALDNLAVATSNPALSWSGSGTTSNWSSSASWNGATVSGTQALSFSGSAARHSVNDLSLDAPINGLIFDAGAIGFTLSGSRIALNGNITNLSSQPQTVNLSLKLDADGTGVDALGGDIAIAGNITGIGSLSKAGSNMLILSGSNDYTGGTYVADGTLELLSANALGNGSTVSVESGATLKFGSSPPAASSVVVPEPGTLVLLASFGMLVCLKSIRRGRPFAAFGNSLRT